VSVSLFGQAKLDFLRRFLPRFAVIKHLQAGRLHHIKVCGFRIMRTLWIARHKAYP
jgi:hypothetical protein